jgi:hypothetical protein
MFWRLSQFPAEGRASESRGRGAACVAASEGLDMLIMASLIIILKAPRLTRPIHRCLRGTILMEYAFAPVPGLCGGPEGEGSGSRSQRVSPDCPPLNGAGIACPAGPRTPARAMRECLCRASRPGFRSIPFGIVEQPDTCRHQLPVIPCRDHEMSGNTDKISAFLIRFPVHGCLIRLGASL